jgi:hypothetical protein
MVLKSTAHFALYMSRLLHLTRRPQQQAGCAVPAWQQQLSQVQPQVQSCSRTCDQSSVKLHSHSCKAPAASP